MDQQRFLIDGAREIVRAAQCGVPLQELWIEPQLANPDLLKQVLACVPNIIPQELSRPLWRKLAYGERDDGMLAVAPTPCRKLKDLSLGPAPLVVILDHVEKPGNIGAIARTADAVGAELLILADGSPDIFNPNTIRASVGALFQIPTVAAPASEVRGWLAEHKLRVAVARTDALLDYDRADLAPPIGLILGSESQGTSYDWDLDHAFAVKLPMCGRGDSLNVSVAAAVLMYESLRQLRARGRCIE